MRIFSKNRPAKKTLRRGVTLVEVMIVLGVLAFILGTIMLLSSMVTTNMRSNEMAEEAIDIINAVMNFRSGGADPVGISTITEKSLAQSGVLPSRYIAPDKNGLVDPWGAPIQVFVTSQATYVNFNYVTKSACVHMATFDFGSGVKHIQIGSSGLLTTAISTKQAIQYCSTSSGFFEVAVFM